MTKSGKHNSGFWRLRNGIDLDLDTIILHRYYYVVRFQIEFRSVIANTAPVRRPYQVRDIGA